MLFVSTFTLDSIIGKVNKPASIPIRALLNLASARRIALQFVKDLSLSTYMFTSYSTVWPRPGQSVTLDLHMTLA